MRRSLTLIAVASLLFGACSGSDDQPATSGGEAAVTLDRLPEPRTEVTGAASTDAFFAVGGLRADGAATPQVDVWEPAGWTRAPDLPEGLHHSSAVWWQDRLWVIGGFGPELGQWVPRGEVRSWSSGEDSWRAERPLPSPRGALAAAVVDGHLVVVGGVGPAGLSGEAWIRAAAGGWVAAPGLNQAREHHAAAGGDGRVYAIGGRTAGLDTNLDSVESWAPGEPSWRAEPALQKSRSGVGAAWHSGRPCVAGGEGPDGTEPLIECLSGDRWEPAGRLAAPRHGLAVASLAGWLHVVGGGPDPGLTVSGVHERMRAEPDAQ